MSEEERRLFKRLSLPGYLDELSSTPWEWGLVDCTQCVNTWIVRIRGVDPLGAYRGRYHSASDAKRTARLAGGFLPAIGERFYAAGLARTHTFEEGDVAAVNADERFVLPVVGAILAIRFGNLWAAKAQRGIVARNFSVIHGWRL